MCLSGISSNHITMTACPSSITRRDSGVDVGSRRNSIEEEDLQSVMQCCSHSLHIAQKQDAPFTTLSSENIIQAQMESAKRSYEISLSQTLAFQVPKRQKSCPAISKLHAECYPKIQMLATNCTQSQLFQQPPYNIATYFRYSPPLASSSMVPAEINAPKTEECIKPCKYKPSKRLLALLCADSRHIPQQLHCLEYTAAYHLRKEVIRWIHQVLPSFHMI